MDETLKSLKQMGAKKQFSSVQWQLEMSRQRSSRQWLWISTPAHWISEYCSQYTQNPIHVIRTDSPDQTPADGDRSGVLCVSFFDS